MEHFCETAASGGSFPPSPPPHVSKTTGALREIQKVLRRLGKSNEGNIMLVISGTDDVTGQVKVKVFDEL